jgi:periplasmic protein CpxP/Spy
MYRINPRRTLAALGMSVAIAIVAAAQTGAAQTPRSLPAAPPNQDRTLNRQQDSQTDRQYGRRDTRTPEGRLERRLTYLHGQLGITPAQESAWTNFTAALRDDARERNRDRVQGGGFNDRDALRGRPERRDDRAGDARQGPSVVERLEERRRIIADREADLDHVLNALRPLYASFTAEQRRTADRLMFQPREDDRGGFDSDRRGPPRDGRVNPRGERGTPDYR